MTPSNDRMELRRTLRAIQDQAWARGERLRVEQLVEAHPELAQGPESLLDLVCGEFRCRQERGEKPEIAEYKERFPALAGELEVQIEVCRSLLASSDAGNASAISERERKYAQLGNWKKAGTPPPDTSVTAGGAVERHPAMEIDPREDRIAEYHRLHGRAEEAVRPSSIEVVPPPPTRSPVDLTAKIRRSDHGETLAVLALLLPVLAQAFLLSSRTDSYTIHLAVSFGTVLVTALLLAIDAAFLEPTDLQGRARGNPVGLFIGMVLLWIAFYPAVFFLRSRFGRPNLGPLALIVTAFFLGAPYIQGWLAPLGTNTPSCDSPEVKAMVEDMMRQSEVGPILQSLHGYRETDYDPESRTRKGECLMNTRNGQFLVTFSVRLVNRTTGTYTVSVDGMVPRDEVAKERR